MSQDIEIRYTVKEDASYLREWFADAEVIRNFPMEKPLEVTDTINRWMSYLRFHSSLTAVHEGKPIGMSLFWLQFYERVKHNALLTLMVDKNYRGRGVGAFLLDTLLNVGKNHLGITGAFLEVYEGNRAINLYRRKGFKEYGFQKKWVLDKEEYIGRTIMYKEL